MNPEPLNVYKRIPLYALMLIPLLWISSAAALEVRMEGEQISIHADRVPLQTVMKRFTQLGITVRMDPALNPEVTVSFENRDIRDGLNAVLKSIDHILVWQSIQGPAGPIPKLSEIHIFRRGGKDRMKPLEKKTALTIVKNPKDGSLFVKDEILLRLKPGITQAEFVRLLREIGGVILEGHEPLGLYRIRVPENTDIPALIEGMAKRPGIKKAEPNYAYPIALPARHPESLGDADVMDRGASQGSVPIAILDTGLASDSEVSSRVVAFYDSLNPDAPISDPLGHGTQMAFIASGAVRPHGAREDSDMQNPIIAVRAFDENGYTSNFNLMRSIDFALEQGARVMSLSWGSDIQSEFLENALDYAGSKGLIMVASAGNEPTGKPVYPAAYPSVLGVGALAPDGEAWKNSNYGDFVALYAPGFATLPIGYNGAPGSYAGTSISAAFVAGIIAEYLSQNPDATKQDVLTALRNQF